MTSLYAPAFNVFTALPFFVRWIVNPGPTVPTSVGVESPARERGRGESRRDDGDDPNCK